jgi:hypothetical protein
VVQVENLLDQEIEFEMHAEDCSSSNADRYPTAQYDMYGGSSWEKIPDVLSMYGMCSYRNWFSYVEFIDPSDASRQNLGLCGIREKTIGCDPLASEARMSRWWDVLRPHSEDMQSLWDTGRFRVHPHVCDRQAHYSWPLLCALVGNAFVLTSLNGCEQGLSAPDWAPGLLTFLHIDSSTERCPRILRH